MSQKAANLVLQTTPGTLESIVDRKINLGVALVGIRLVPNIDFLFVRQSEPDMDLEKTAGPAVLAWTL
jgi:hypothetical protein